MKRALFFIFIFLVFLSACKDKTTTGFVIKPTQEQVEEETSLMRGNRKMITLESEEIDLFIKRYGWNMTKTATGLRYEVLKQGKGKLLKEGEEVEIKFITQFLTGDTVYTSQKYGNKVFTINKTDEIVALHEAMFLLKKGAIARLIIPSHLAYGISGDGDRIIGQHSLVMHIELLNTKSITKQ
jgi:FKBP-type peptidyl-prolyl cis-trans isomerase FkpA